MRDRGATRGGDVGRGRVTRRGATRGWGGSRGPRGRAGKTGQRWVRTERERGSSTARRVAEAGQHAVQGGGTRGAEWGQKVAPDPEDRGGLGSEAEMVLRGLECAGDSGRPHMCLGAPGSLRDWLGAEGGPARRRPLPPPGSGLPGGPPGATPQRR